MRDNLIFTNIFAEDKEKYCTASHRFFQQLLNLTSIRLELAPRLLSKHKCNRCQTGKSAPIVAKFSFFKEMEPVRKSGYLLALSNISIQKHFPEEIEQRRIPLYPFYRYARYNEHPTATANATAAPIKSTKEIRGGDSQTKLSFSCLNLCGLNRKLP